MALLALTRYHPVVGSLANARLGALAVPSGNRIGTVATPAPLTALAGMTITGAHCVAPPAVTTLVCACALVGSGTHNTALIQSARLTACTHNRVAPRCSPSESL